MTITFENRKHGFNLEEISGAIKAKVEDYSMYANPISEEKALHIEISETASSFRVTAKWVKAIIVSETSDEVIWDDDYFTLLKSEPTSKFIIYMEELLNNVTGKEIITETHGQYIDSLKSNDE